MKNTAIAKVFYDIADLLELKGENAFKVRAYQKAARAIELWPRELETMVQEGEDLGQIPGVGEAIARKTTDLATTGHLELYDKLLQEFPEGIVKLLDIPGIGPKTAMRLSSELGIKSVDELERAINDGSVAALPHMGGKTAENILSQIQALRRKDQRIPIGEALPLVEEIMAMTNPEMNSSDIESVGGPGDAEAIRHLKDMLGQGKNWYVALLEAIGLWGSSSELYRGRRYNYLIGGEAFDWLLLAERLLAEVKGLVSEDDAVDLLFSGKPPVELSKEEFKRLIGPSKYKAHLNFVYGVVVEEALLMAVEEEVHKERNVMAYESGDVNDEASQRVYGAPRQELLARVQQGKGIPSRDSLTLADMREFTYWLFKYRMATCDPERVASDTRKALNQLRKAGARNLYL